MKQAALTFVIGLMALTCAFAQAASQELAPNSLVVTHATRRYQTGTETVSATQALINSAQGSVIALTDEPLATSTRWYGLPLSKITAELHSDAGEHTLQVPLKVQEPNFSVTMIGGYLSACLSVSIREVIASYLERPSNIQTLTIHLPMGAIYTGFTNQGGKLIPSTPYGEASLDLSMDGLNIEQAVSLVPISDRKAFLEEIANIAVLKTYRMNQVAEDLYSIEVLLNGQRITRRGSSSSSKKILLSFESEAPLFSAESLRPAVAKRSL